MKDQHLRPLLGLLLAACASHAVPSAGGLSRSPAPASPSPKLIEDLSLLAVGELPPAAVTQERFARMQRGELTVEAYVDALLDDQRFAQRLAPEILLGRVNRPPAFAQPRGYVLKTQRSTGDDRVLYYLRKACEVRDAVAVHPWWNLGAEVLVCPDSYQPSHIVEPKTRWYCGSANLEPEQSSYCGCGPALINCLRDGTQRNQLNASLWKESVATIAHVVGKNLPIRELFLMNETYRDGLAEFYYNRWAVIAGELKTIPDLHDWPTEGKLAPRRETVPGQHAGILTDAHFLFMSDGPRDRLRTYYDQLWCKPPASVNVDAEQIVALNTGNLRDGAGGERLAAMPICTNCHARLDYGMKFFTGYLASKVGALFAPSEFRAGKGSLYRDDIKDERGAGELTPRGFATLAVQQPEFASCMVSDVMDHVFNGGASVDDTKAVIGEFQRTGTLRGMMRAALVRYASRPGGKPLVARELDPPPGVGAPAAAEVGIGTVAFSSSLRTAVAEHCLDCHEEGPLGFLKGDALPHSIVQKMLSEVAFGRMPKTAFGLPDAVRLRLVSELIDSLWNDDDSRREARRYFVQHMHTLPVHRINTIITAVHGGSQTQPGRNWELAESTVSQDVAQYTPGLAAIVSLEALLTCKAAGHTEPAALRDCVERSISVNHIVNGPIPTK